MADAEPLGLAAETQETAWRTLAKENNLRSNVTSLRTPTSTVADFETFCLFISQIENRSSATTNTSDEEISLQSNSAREIEERSKARNDESSNDMAPVEVGEGIREDRGSEIRIQRLPLQVGLTAVGQSQILSAFLNLYFPESSAKSNTCDRRSYLLDLPAVDFYACPMLSDAVSAMCFCHMGKQCDDERLVQRSQRCYGKALVALSRLVHRPDSRPHVASGFVIATIMTLCFYDNSMFFQGLDETWKTHYCGVHEYIKAKGPSILCLGSSFETLLFRNLRMSMPFIHLSTRRAIAWAEPPWRRFKDATPPIASPIRRLIDRIMACLPALLERSDQVIIQASRQRTPVKQLLLDLLDMHSSLEHWHDVEFPNLDKRYGTVDASKQDEFSDGIEEHLIFTTNDTFQYFYTFDAEIFARGEVLYWLSSLVVDCTILRVLHFFPSTENDIAPTTRALVLQRALEAAQHLCRSAYALSKYPSQGFAGLLDTCMSLAANFYSEILATRELGWVLATRCATALRVKRLRETQPRTLCRIGDLADGIGATGKFRTRIIRPKG